MNRSLDPQFADQLTRATQAAPLFDNLVEDMVGYTRKYLHVPDEVDEEIQAEFVALRSRFRSFYPEFCKVFAQLLMEQLQEDDCPKVIGCLSSAEAQQYLRRQATLERDFRAELKPFFSRMLRSAQSFTQSNRNHNDSSLAFNAFVPISFRPTCAQETSSSAAANGHR